MEGIDLAGVVDSDFQGIQINFALPRPAGFANFHGAGRDKTCFFRGGAALFPRGGRGGEYIPGINTRTSDEAKWRLKDQAVSWRQGPWSL